MQTFNSNCINDKHYRARINIKVFLIFYAENIPPLLKQKKSKQSQNNISLNINNINH